MTSGVGTIEELSNVITGAPFRINADDNDLTRTYAWSGTAHNSTSTETDLSGFVRTNLVRNPSFEIDTTGWATNGTIAQSTAQAFAGTHSLLVAWPTNAAHVSYVQNVPSGLTVGDVYTFSAWVYVPSGNPDVCLSTGFGAFGEPTSVKDQWTRISLTFTATAAGNSVKLTTAEASTSGQICYLDAVLLEDRDALENYFDGSTPNTGGSGITEPTDGTVLRTNLVPNPSFETNTTGWTAGSNTVLTRVTGGDSTGSHAQGSAEGALTRTGSTGTAQATTATGTSGIPVTAGEVYTVSGYFNRVTSPARTVTIAVIWYNAAGSVISTSTPPGVADTNVWTRFSAQVTAPAGAAFAALNPQVASAAALEGHLIDGFMFEHATAVSDYFDGGTTDTDSRLYDWTGTANGSASTETATFTELVSIDTASEADQIELTRDSNPGALIFEDPDGVVVMKDDDAVSREGSASHTLGPDDYSAIDMSFDMSHIINVVTIKYVEKIKKSGKKTRKVEHDHTYVDTASRAKYGPKKKTVTVHKKEDFAAHAQRIFDRNADPENVPTSVTVTICANGRQVADLLPQYEDGTYVGRKIDIEAPDGTIYTARISRIEHAIAPDVWQVKVFLRNASVIQKPRADSDRDTVTTEVANNPDGMVLSAHIEDDIDGTGKTLTGAIFQNASGVTDGGVAGFRFEDDTAGGVLKFYTGDPGEGGPGYLNPDIDTDSGRLFVELASPVVSGQTRAHVWLTHGNPGEVQLRNTALLVEDDATVDGDVFVGGGINAANLITSGGQGVQVTGSGNTVKIASPPSGGSANVNWNSVNGSIRQVTSARRFKTDIEPFDVDVEAALKMQPQVYTRLDRDEDEPEREVGFIAEDAEQLALTPWVVYDQDGEVVSFDYFKWVVALQAVCQSQQGAIEVLTARVEALESR
jgi:hypothetical protein